MLCSHITADKCVERVPKDMFRKKQVMEDMHLFLEGNSNRGGLKSHETYKTFCTECDSCQKSLMCLSCGQIFCGRNDSGHALEHSQEFNHPVVIDCISFELYCYTCDDEVTLDFEPSLYSVTKSLRLLFDREDVVEGGGGDLLPQPTSQSVVVANLSDTVSSVNLRMNGSKGSKKKRGKKGKVSPMLDTPFMANVTVCQAPTSSSGNSGASGASEIAFRPRGLRNIGNTCFMNAVLQALASLDEFKEYILNLPSLEDYVEGESKNGNCFLTDEYRKLLISLSSRSFRDPSSPHEFREAFVSACPRFRGFRQHDSHEFMRYLLDQMHTEMKKCRNLPEMHDEKEKSTPISVNFEGLLQSRVICQTCRNCSDKNDEFMDLSLDIPRVQKGRVHLAECLDTFFQREILDRGEKPECSKCKTKQTCSKQMFIKKLPEVLCLHIKRFRDNGGKMDTHIEYPIAGLSVDEFLTEDSDEPPCVYDLQSIIVHIGYGCGSGHYIAFGKRAGGKWYQFDDTVVKSIDNSFVTKQKAYVLLYTKTARKP